jgi:sec-independent protein translocase protein TatA
VFGLGAEELVIILAIVVMIFGANRLPELGSGVGKAIRNFKGEPLRNPVRNPRKKSRRQGP